MSAKQLLALTVILLLGCPRSAYARQSLKQTLLEIPTGSVVSVKLANHETVRGKLGPISDIGFELQTVQSGAVTSKTVQYADVKSVHQQGKGMSKGTKITLISLACVGLAFIGLIIYVKVSGPFVF